MTTEQHKQLLDAVPEHAEQHPDHISIDTLFDKFATIQGWGRTHSIWNKAHKDIGTVAYMAFKAQYGLSNLIFWRLANMTCNDLIELIENSQYAQLTDLMQPRTVQ
jgi:hypothetical protein